MKDGQFNRPDTVLSSVDGRRFQRLQPYMLSSLSSLSSLSLLVLAALSSLLLAVLAAPLADPASLLEARRPPRKASTCVIVKP